MSHPQRDEDPHLTGAAMSGRWTPEDDALVLDMYDEQGGSELAFMLGRSLAAVRIRIGELRKGETPLVGGIVRMNLVDKFAGKYEAPAWQTRAGSEDHRQYKAKGTLC